MKACDKSHDSSKFAVVSKVLWPSQWPSIAHTQSGLHVSQNTKEHCQVLWFGGSSRPLLFMLEMCLHTDLRCHAENNAKTRKNC